MKKRDVFTSLFSPYFFIFAFVLLYISTILFFIGVLKYDNSNMITKISMISNLILGIPPFCVGLLGDYSIRA